MRKVELTRPALPAIAARLEWPGTVVAVFGADARAFAERIALRLRESGAQAHLLRVELRHAPGGALEGDPAREATLHVHPEALTTQLERLRPAGARFTVGVGAAFAAAVRADLSIWIRGRRALSSLPDAERALASEARMVLEEPRLAAADHVASRLAHPGQGRGEGL